MQLPVTHEGWELETKCCQQPSYGKAHVLHSFVEECAMKFHVYVIKSVSP